MTEFTRSEGGVLMPQQRLVFGGVFDCALRRDGKIIDEWQDRNLVTNEGLNSILGVVFHGDTQITAWYIGLFEANYTPIATVTAATITSASTESTAYDEATRVAYDEAAAASQAITNAASRATFTMNATKTIYGAFLVSASAKSATTGTLMAAAKFSTAKAVVDNDELLITYAFAASSV